MLHIILNLLAFFFLGMFLYYTHEYVSLVVVYYTTKKVKRGDKYWFDVFLLKSRLSSVQQKRNEHLFKAFLCITFLVVTIFFIMFLKIL